MNGQPEARPMGRKSFGFHLIVKGDKEAALAELAQAGLAGEEVQEHPTGRTTCRVRSQDPDQTINVLNAWLTREVRNSTVTETGDKAFPAGSLLWWKPLA